MSEIITTKLKAKYNGKDTYIIESIVDINRFIRNLFTYGSVYNTYYQLLDDTTALSILAKTRSFTTEEWQSQRLFDHFISISITHNKPIPEAYSLDHLTDLLKTSLTPNSYSQTILLGLNL
ncbi:Hypothetical protein MVR_LOCUS241 [uncultured virus]|nr:Hypothetical protein MVR_LOCUS241 [uncultured virus]